MLDIISPIDGSVVFQVEHLAVADARARVGAARAAGAAFGGTSLEERISLCRAMVEAYESALETNAIAITKMMGKPLSQARGEFLGGVKERVEHLCQVASRALADVTLPEKPGFRRFIRREPVGVVLDIAAWNYPLLIAINVIVPAVLAGNAVVIKHASQTAPVADQFEAAFKRAGAPDGLVSALHVSHETLAQLVADGSFGYVSFTGSTRGGREVYQTVASHNFVPVGLELGGKDPAYVAADADLEYAVENLVDGAFYNCGQSCCAVERIYVDGSRYDDFVEAYAARVHGYVLGNPLEEATTLGPLVNAAAAKAVDAQVEAAVAAGARLVTDPKRFDVPMRTPCYRAPRVLADANHSMEIMREETFGPAIAIMRVAGDDEAIALMNDSAYGLTGSIWTRDDERALALAQRVDAGTVYQNRCDYLDPALCWTGWKDSGCGASLSDAGFLSVTRPKSFHLRSQPT